MEQKQLGFDLSFPSCIPLHLAVCFEKKACRNSFPREFDAELEVLEETAEAFLLEGRDGGERGLEIEDLSLMGFLFVSLEVAGGAGELVRFRGPDETRLLEGDRDAEESWGKIRIRVSSDHPRGGAHSESI